MTQWYEYVENEGLRAQREMLSTCELEKFSPAHSQALLSWATSPIQNQGFQCGTQTKKGL